MQRTIVGTTMPVLGFTLENGEAIIAEASELGWIGGSAGRPAPNPATRSRAYTRLPAQ